MDKFLWSQNIAQGILLKFYSICLHLKLSLRTESTLAYLGYSFVDSLQQNTSQIQATLF